MNLVGREHPDYQSYLLRVWRDDVHTPWRASLQSTVTERVVQFADLEAMFVFLMAQTSLASEPTNRSTHEYQEDKEYTDDEPTDES